MRSLVLVGLLVTAACSTAADDGEATPAAPTTARDSTTSAPPSATSSAAGDPITDASACVGDNPLPVERSQLPPEVTSSLPEGDAVWGSGSLYTVQIDATYQVSRLDDGIYYVKMPWFRTVPGAIEITAERHGGGGTFTGTINQGGGPVGFQPSALTFSEAGCWKVTGTHEDGSTISFDMWIPEGGNV